MTDTVIPILDFGLQPVRAYAPEGLGPGEVGFAPVECPSRSMGQALHPSTSIAYGAGRAGIVELRARVRNSK